MIKAVTFDFWSTLYRGRTPKYTERLLSLKAAVEEGSDARFELAAFEAALKAARRAWNRAWVDEHRTIGAPEWLSILTAELGVSLRPRARAAIEAGLENTVLQDLPTLAPGLVPVLADLSARYRLAIISDTGLTPGRVLRQVLAHDNVFDYFSHCTFSDELGRSKPHADAFLSTLAALNAKPQQAVHVGDTLRTDIAGAQNVGMRAVQYVGLNHDDYPGVTPDAVIHSHTELASWLNRWNGNSPKPPPG
ncbi:MAG: HAD family hydrolase [Anaerolineae bacterium]